MRKRQLSNLVRTSEAWPGLGLLTAWAMMLVLFFLGGCANGPTLQELEDEAMRTGDWSAYEAKEKRIERRKKRGLPCGGKPLIREGRLPNGVPFYQCL